MGLERAQQMVPVDCLPPLRASRTASEPRRWGVESPARDALT